MRIGIDATMLAAPQWSGAMRYIGQLVNGLAEIDEENMYYIYSACALDNAQLGYIKQKDNFAVRILDQYQSFRGIYPYNNSNLSSWIRSLHRFGVYEQLLLPKYLKKDRVNIFHSTQNALPLIKACRSILTVHWTTPLVHPEVAQGSINSQLFILLYRLLTPKMIAKADRVIANCETDKSNIIEAYNYPEEKIRIIHCCVDKIVRIIENQEEKEKVKAKYGTTDDFILCVDSVSFHGELLSLLKTFHKLKREVGIPHKLVIVGELSLACSSHVSTFIEEKGLNGEIVQTGNVPHEDLVRLYNTAALFTYPATYEGFGIVPLEAMTCGIPVIAITSTATVVREEIGDAGVIIDPHNIDRLTHMIYTLLTDKTLRSKMREKGFKRAERFNWRSIARGALEIYRELETNGI